MYYMKFFDKYSIAKNIFDNNQLTPRNNCVIRLPSSFLTIWLHMISSIQFLRNYDWEYLHPFKFCACASWEDTKPISYTADTLNNNIYSNFYFVWNQRRKLCEK